MYSKCLECECIIHPHLWSISLETFGLPLCADHQKWIRNHMEARKATLEVVQLYFALKERCVPVELYKMDQDRVDLTIDNEKLLIEVDSINRNYNHKIAIQDFRRSHSFFKKGYLTIRIPTFLVTDHLEETADQITEMLEISLSRIWPRISSFKWLQE